MSTDGVVDIPGATMQPPLRTSLHSADNNNELISPLSRRAEIATTPRPNVQRQPDQSLQPVLTLETHTNTNTNTGTSGNQIASPAITHQRRRQSHSYNNSQTQNRRPSIYNSPSSSYPLSVLHPRPFEDIYAEQAYLSMNLQAQVQILSDLINRYASTEEESIHGDSRKSKRRARKQLGPLRSQLIHAAEQERAIFARLGELYVESMTRQTWSVARRRSSQQSMRRGSNQPNGERLRRESRPGLNGATPEFVPHKDDYTHLEGDKESGSSTNTSDDEQCNHGIDICRKNSAEMGEVLILEDDEETNTSRANSAREGNVLITEDDETTNDGPRRPHRRMTDDDYEDCDPATMRRRRLSLPDNLDFAKTTWIL